MGPVDHGGGKASGKDATGALALRVASGAEAALEQTADSNGGDGELNANPILGMPQIATQVWPCPSFQKAVHTAEETLLFNINFGCGALQSFMQFVF